MPSEAVRQIMQQMMSGGGEGQPVYARDKMLGYQVRSDLFPGEDAYFRANQNVAGMAAETGDVILNPYSPPNINRDAVAQNEAFRLHLRENNIDPQFQVTPQQRMPFEGTAYGSDDAALRATIAARIYSGDPSANATYEQRQWMEPYLAPMGSILGIR
jgi:hypothetical protein